MSIVTAPFPHLVADDVWDPDLLRMVLGEFPDESDQRWRRFGGDRELKLEGGPGMWGPATRELFEQIALMPAVLVPAFGMDGLGLRPGAGLSMETIGGGYHVIPVGGYLAVHTDFNRSPDTGLYRRLNLLIYLNEGWVDDDGGHLELWDDDGPSVRIAPEMNRTVVFATSDLSWHGHPVPTKRVRRSVAAYFYTDTAPDGYTTAHSTVWHPRGQVHA